MGNQLSEFEIDERYKLIKKIFNIANINKIEIGDRVGHSGYIDFIEPELLVNDDILKGIDIYSRSFIVFKAEIILQDNSKIQTFTTFFKRYHDSDIVWHACGHYGLNLFDTCGGANNTQIKILYDLLSNKTIDLSNMTIDQIDNIKLLWNRHDNDDAKNISPIRIDIGHSSLL